MALTDPLDLLTGFPGWCTDFGLMPRQEQSRHASGRTRVKDLGSPIWRGSWQSPTLAPNALDRWRARLSHAEISQLRFTAWFSSRCRPMLHPGSGVLPVAALSEIGDDDKTVRITGLGAITLSVGDLIQIGGNLHRVLEPASGSPTALFTIEPHLWPGVAIDDDVLLNKPACLMTIDPGSVSASADPRTGRGSISFTATEAR